LSAFGVGLMQIFATTPSPSTHSCGVCSPQAVQNDKVRGAPSIGSPFCLPRVQVTLLQPFVHKSTRAHPYSPRTSVSFTSNFAKIRSHFALSRHARHEPHVQPLYGASGGSAVSSRDTAAVDAARECGPILLSSVEVGPHTLLRETRSTRWA